MKDDSKYNGKSKVPEVISQDGRVFGLYLYHFLKVTGKTGLVSWSPKNKSNAPMYLYSIS